MLRLRYPNLFSTAARNAVEAESLRAMEDFEKANPSKYPSDIRSDGKPYLHYILRVFLAFAREACKLGSDGTWSMDRIMVECRLFASSIVRGVLDFKAPDARWEPFFDGPLERLMNDDFGNGPEFAPYRQLLHGVAESSPEPEESDWTDNDARGPRPNPEPAEQEQAAAVAKGGRPVESCDVDPELVRQIRGRDSTRTLSTKTGLSVSTINRLESRHRASEKTVKILMKEAKAKSLKIREEDLKKKDSSITSIT